MRVLIVEGQTLVQQGLASLIEAKAGWSLVGLARNGREGLELATELKPDVCITSVMLDELNGIDLAERIRTASPGTRVVLLSRYADADTCRRALRAGVSAFLSMRDGFDCLLQAARALAQGRVYLSPSAAAQMNGHASPRVRGLEPTAPVELSLREREVVQLLAEGRLAKEIAHERGLSVKTVESHRRRAMEKLGFDSVSDLTRYAVRQGLVRLDVATTQAPVDVGSTKASFIRFLSEIEDSTSWEDSGVEA